MQKINVNLYGGKGLFGGRETPLEADIIFCECPEKCTFYQNGKCLKCRAFMAPENCPYGSKSTVRGYTSRAAKYYDFRKRYETDPVYGKLKYPNEIVAVMGDTLYIYTSYVSVRKRTENDEKWRKDTNGYIVGDCGFGGNYVFMPMESATNELLYKIFSYSPSSLMGGSIKSWKEERVPEILQELRKYAPDIHKRFVSEYPEYDVAPSYIGKMAFIDSLKPCTKFRYKNAEWYFDGEYVESVEEIDIGSGSPWWLQDGSKSRVRIKVTPKMQFKVEDNSIIDDDVRFA